MQYKKFENEGFEEYEFRICEQKGSDGLETWDDVADVVNSAFGTEYTSSKIRKDYQTFNRMLVAYNKLHGEEDKSLLLDKKMAELRKETQKFYDQRREYNKILIKAGRTEAIEDRLVEAANNLNRIIPLNHHGFYSQDTTDGEAVLFLSDWHYGMTADNIFNKYNIDICHKRIIDIVDRTKNKLMLYKPKKLHIVILGDMCDGCLRASNRVAQEEYTVNQLMQASELIAEVIDELSGFVSSTEVYCTYGNHMRSVQNIKDSIHADNMEKIIGWWLIQRFKDRNDVSIYDKSNLGEATIVNVCNRNIVCVHGDLDGIATSGSVFNDILSRKYGMTIDYLVMGHTHSVKTNDKDGIRAYVVGSLCGADDYANGKRLYSNPSQTLMTFNAKYGLDGQYELVVE